MRLTRSLAVLASFLVSAVILGVVGAVPALAAPNAVPFEFVGKADDCGLGYPAGSRIVTARWLRGMGLPDNGGPNVGSDPTDNPNKKDPHHGLLLSKNGTTADCSASGARITGVGGITLTATSELGFDYRNGGHCGAGAPRFNVVVTPPSGPNTFHFVGGCSNDGAPVPAPQDPLQWTRVRFTTSSATESFPPIPAGSTVVSISIVYDEGTDTPTADDPSGIGLAVIDNIFIAGAVITRGPSGDDDDHHDHHDDDDDD
jgi:hypothetical protein